MKYDKIIISKGEGKVTIIRSSDEMAHSSLFFPDGGFFCLWCKHFFIFRNIVQRRFGAQKEDVLFFPLHARENQKRFMLFCA